MVLLLEVAPDVLPAEEREALTARLEGARRSVADALGVPIPALSIHASDALASGGYRVTLNDLPLGRGSAAGPDALVASFTTALERKGRELVGVQEVGMLVEQLARTHPILVAETVPRLVPLIRLTEVLKRLLDERVSIRNLRTIVETLAGWSAIETNEVALTEHVRTALRGQISEQHGPGGEVICCLLGEEIEDACARAIRETPSGEYLDLAPDLTAEILGAVRDGLAAWPEGERAPVLLTSQNIRPYVRKLLELEQPDVPVLSYTDLDPDVVVRPLARITLAPRPAEEVQAPAEGDLRSLQDRLRSEARTPSPAAAELLAGAIAHVARALVTRNATHAPAADLAALGTTLARLCDALGVSADRTVSGG